VTQCSIDVDADIAGEGVRIGAFVQVCVLILVSMLGSFHTRVTGAKEIGAGVVLTSVSLAIALIVRMARRTLTPVNAIISAMILDGQNMALTIQLAAKETLTSRWQVVIVVLAQFVSLRTYPPSWPTSTISLLLPTTAVVLPSFGGDGLASAKTLSHQ